MSANDTRQWRLERYEELGFEPDAAAALADAYDEAAVPDRQGIPRRWRTPLHWGKVQKALQAGASHEQCVEWFA